MTDNNLLFSIYEGNQNFSNKGHLDNFYKYLFSNSKNHSKNEMTKFNFYCCDNENKFITNNLSDLKTTKKKIENKLSNYEKIYNDLQYVFFMVEIDGVLVSNMIDTENESIYLTVGNETLEELSLMFFNGEINEVLDEIKNTISKHTKFLSFRKCSQEQRNYIEIYIHEYLSKYNLKDEDEILISVSHNDQNSPYHLHRIVKSI